MAGGWLSTFAVFEVDGPMERPASLVWSTAVMPTAKARVPFPVTMVHVKVNVCRAPFGSEAVAGVGPEQSADAVPPGSKFRSRITESAALPLLLTVAVTVMVDRKSTRLN